MQQYEELKRKLAGLPPKQVKPKPEPKTEQKEERDLREKYLYSSIPDSTKHKFHVKKRDAIIAYIKKHPEISFQKVTQWVADIKIGAFTLKELED